MNTSDILILVASLALTLGIGLAARPAATPEAFHLGNKAIRWIPLGLSMMASVFSAVNVTGFSGEVAQNGLFVLMVLPAFLVVIPPVWRIAIPKLRESCRFDAYELLEKRHGAAVRRLADWLFVCWRCFWMALALYAAGQVVGRAAGVPPALIVILAGVTTMLYTARGGMRAVVWTSTFQMCVLIGGILFATVEGVSAQGGIVGLFAGASRLGLLRPFHPFDPLALSPAPTVRLSLWSCLIGGTVAYLGRYSANQMIVQRYLSARSTAEARRSFVLNIGMHLVALLLLSLMGLAIATGSAAEANASPVARFTAFVCGLPAGIAGLFIAGLMACTLSGIDSGIHSCVTAITAPDRAARQPGFNEKTLTLLIGSATTTLACFAGTLGSIFEISNRIVNAFGSPMLALFLAGWLWPRISPRSVLLGGIAGATLSVVSGILVEPLALHYYAVINLLGTLLLCALFEMTGGFFRDSSRQNHT